MTASPHRLGAGPEAGNYYTNDSAREARPDRRDEYYAKDGDGVWWSTGETIVRHGAAIDRQSFRDLCAGIDPRTGNALVRGAGASHNAGTDITMTPGKSVSVLWMAGDTGQREIIEAAHRKAVSRALQLIMDEEMIVVRSGAGGAIRHKPADLIVGRFDHFTTREGDANVHSHCIIMNVAGAPAEALSGRYRYKHLTTDPEQVFKLQRMIGAAYRAELASELTQHLGVRFREAGQGQWEIAGISDEVLTTFSKRSAQIEAHAGRGASPAQREVAALATRKGKDQVPTGDELEARWKSELAALAVDPWQQMRVLGPEVEPDSPEPPFDPPELPGDGPVARAASELFRHESVIEHKDLLQRALELAGLAGLGPDIVEAELTTLQNDGRLLRLDDEARPQRWTTPAIAACEAAMLRAAERPDERDWLTGEAVDAALAAAPHLSGEQRDAVRSVATRDGVALIEAGAGTGKTTMARALVDAAHRSGLKVVGLSPAWVPADELAASIGIAAQATARWRHDHARGAAAPLDDRTLIILDEAGMVSTRDMEAVLTAAREAGSKVVLVGDRLQLASVAGASALRAVADIVARSAVMTEVRRQEVDWQKAATVVMARGDSEAGLRAYAMHDRLELVSGTEAAQARTIAAWRDLREAHADDVLIITRRNADAADLNQKARELLKQEGRLGLDTVALPSLDRADKPVKLALAIGDRLRFGETLPQYGIRNGNRATVRAITLTESEAPRLTLALDDGRSLDLNWHELAREPRYGRKRAPPRVVHAYAGTAHSVQGRSAAASVVHIARATDAREVYVSLSRHRHDTRIIVERDRLDALCRSRQADPRLPASDAVVQEKLFAEAGRYHDKRNVGDHVGDREAFLRRGDVQLHRDERGRITSVLLTARLLREAMRWLRGASLVLSRLGIALSAQLERTNLEKAEERLSDRIAEMLRPRQEAHRQPRIDRDHSLEY